MVISELLSVTDSFICIERNLKIATSFLTKVRAQDQRQNYLFLNQNKDDIPQDLDWKSTIVLNLTKSYNS